jgi:hypothetical protein
MNGNRMTVRELINGLKKHNLDQEVGIGIPEAGNEGVSNFVAIDNLWTTLDDTPNDDNPALYINTVPLS